MTNCPICNGKVDEKAKFCPECGVQLTKSSFGTRLDRGDAREN